jgi:DNA-directed RNA polymerase specialized sigma24 family protein
VNCVETIFELPSTDVAFSDSFAAQPESLPSGADPAGMVCGTGQTDFSTCYARELSSLVWFVMSLGADAHRAADIAQSAFGEAFAVWDRIQHPTAWLRRVAGRLYYRNLVTQETSVEDVPDRQGPPRLREEYSHAYQHPQQGHRRRRNPRDRRPRRVGR